MEPWQALLLGLVEGITEFLPVSSTGHLVLTQRLLGLPADTAAKAYAICIQSGAILAVLGLYLPRVRQMCAGLVGRDAAGLRLLGLLFLALIPSAVAGLLFDDLIESELFGMWPIVGAWFVGGVVILCVKRLRDGLEQAGGRALEALTARHALAIGLFQCLALAPGTSRSLATIAGALLLGFGSAAAVEFSLLLGVLTLGAATCYEAIKEGDVMLAHYGPLSLFLGFASAFVSAWIAVRWLVAFLRSRGLATFGIYRVLLAGIVAVALWQGWIEAK